MLCVFVVMLRVAGGRFPSPCCLPQDGVMVSVRPGMWPEVPDQTAAVARAAFPRGSLPMRLRDHLGAWCSDADFAGLYDAAGRPGLSPAQLMTVTVLQFAE